jgi:signal transduction histidine kinase
MEKILPIARQLSRAKWLPPLVIVLTLVILGVMISLGTRQLRDTIGRQIVHRDAEVLDEVATLEQIGADSPGALARQLDDTSGQLALALRLSRLREGVLATRLFDAQGRFVAAMPVLVKETQLTPAEAAAMARLRPLSRYEPAARLADHFLVGPQAGSNDDARAPLLSVLIPIHAPGQTNLLAVAELIQDGRGIARELAVLDRNLTRQAALAFLISGGIVALGLGWAFRRLQKITRLLQEHAADLRRANQELTLTAKTSALGAVTAHVLHGLTSPLAGLQNFMTTHAVANAEWQDALRGTQRMQALIGEIVRVLGEQSNGTSYELPLAELAQIICDKVRPAAEAAGVNFESGLAARGALSNRNANLVLLILENLLQNAVQATPRGRIVHLHIGPAIHGVACEVEDEGPGLPLTVRENLFMPCRSTKPGGNGIGLTLSRHLARHLGAELVLVRSTEAGCIFALVLPPELLVNGHKPIHKSTSQPALHP